MATLDDLRLSPDVVGDGAGVLAIPRATLAAMLAHIAAGYPNEACGVLAGDDAGRVTRNFPEANASDTPRTFSEIAPRALLDIWNELEAHDWQMLAYYHSHPVSPAYPSHHDVFWSQNWPGMFYIIFSLAKPDAPIVRAFLIEGKTVNEYRVAIEA
jgi:proteasome lid subunit RPN8/RPN11